MSIVDILSQYANTFRAPNMYLGSHAQEHSMFHNAYCVVQLRRSRPERDSFLKRAIQDVMASIGYKRPAASFGTQHWLPPQFLQTPCRRLPSKRDDFNWNFTMCPKPRYNFAFIHDDNQLPAGTSNNLFAQERPAATLD